MSTNSSRDQVRDPAWSEAEFKKTQLEIEKLEVEIANTRKDQLIDSIVRLTPLLTVLVTVIGLGFTVWQYSAEQQKNRRERTETAQREFMKPLLEKQRELYFEASSAAATIAASSDPEERRRAINTFWQLYWGPLIFVESQEVSGAMKRFGECLNGDCLSEGDQPNQPKDVKLKTLSLALASTMEASSLKTWNAKPEDFTTNQFVYH